MLKADKSSVLRTVKGISQCVGMSRSEDALYELIFRSFFLSRFHFIGWLFQYRPIARGSLKHPGKILEMFMLFVLRVLNQFFANIAGPQKLPRRQQKSHRGVRFNMLVLSILLRSHENQRNCNR